MLPHQRLAVYIGKERTQSSLWKIKMHLPVYVHNDNSYICTCGSFGPCHPEAHCATDGDLVKCHECGAEGFVSMDEEGPFSVDWDETSVHNVNCYAKWAVEHPEEAGLDKV